METRIRKSLLHSIGLLAPSVACLILLPQPSSSQSGGDPAKVRIQEMDRRELQLRGLGSDDKDKNDSKNAQAIRDQVGDDFQRILKLHSEMVRSIAANGSLNYEFISNAAGEIKKRATRLQITLGLHKPEPNAIQQQMRDLEGMPTKDELVALCAKIESFVRNPIIDSPGTVNAELLDKARRDLESVVEFSGTIKKVADRQRRP